MDQYWSLFSGYSAIWILLVFYILSLGKKVRQLEERLQSLNDVGVHESGGHDDKDSSL
jgi:CcmD family protein